VARKYKAPSWTAERDEDGRLVSWESRGKLTFPHVIGETMVDIERSLYREADNFFDVQGRKHEYGEDLVRVKYVTVAAFPHMRRGDVVLSWRADVSAELQVGTVVEEAEEDEGDEEED
jgi:hypothetical protein